MLEQALFPPYAEKVVIEAGFHQPNAGASNDPLHLEYSKTITKSRNNFYRVVEGASRGNHELKNDYNEAYKTFKAYLDTTIDMVEHLPQQVGYLLPFFYKSGQLGADLNTSQDGKLIGTNSRHRSISHCRDSPCKMGLRHDDLQLAGAASVCQYRHPAELRRSVGWPQTTGEIQQRRTAETQEDRKDPSCLSGNYRFDCRSEFLPTSTLTSQNSTRSLSLLTLFCSRSFSATP